MPTAEVCRKHGPSQGTFYKHKSKYGGMEVSDVARLSAIEGENAKLKLSHSSDVTPTVNTKSCCSLINLDREVSEQLGQERIRHLSKERILAAK